MTRRRKFAVIAALFALVLTAFAAITQINLTTQVVGVLAKGNGGAGADMTNVTFPSTGTLLTAQNDLSTTSTINSAAVNTTKLSAAARTRVKLVTDFAPVSGDVILSLEEDSAVTLKSFICQVDTGTSVLVDVYTRSWATTGIGSVTSQVTVLSGQYTATTTSAATTSFAAATLAANTPLVIKTGTVTGATLLFCSIHYTLDTGQ